MVEKSLFLAVYPYQEDALTLPVKSINEASQWYCKVFGMEEINRVDGPDAAVILERDGVRLGFEVNGGEKADELTAKEIVTIKGITESASSDFDQYVVGYKKYAEKCEHKEFLMNQLQLTINKREKIIDGSYGQ